MNAKSQLLYEEILRFPLDLAKLRLVLDREQYTPMIISEAIVRFLDEKCWLETQQYSYIHGIEAEEKDLYSPHLIKILQLLLEYGLDPNLIIDDENVMDSLQGVDYPFVSADAMRLLLEHGGDVNLMLDGESMFRNIDFDIVFGAIEQKDRRYYNCWVHLWLVLIGYGGRLPNDVCPLKMKEGYSPAIFKQHERFDWEIEYTNAVSDGWIMHVFEKDTGIEVAEL